MNAFLAAAGYAVKFGLLIGITTAALADGSREERLKFSLFMGAVCAALVFIAALQWPG